MAHGKERESQPDGLEVRRHDSHVHRLCVHLAIRRALALQLDVKFDVSVTDLYTVAVKIRTRVTVRVRLG